MLEPLSVSIVVPYVVRRPQSARFFCDFRIRGTLDSLEAYAANMSRPAEQLPGFVSTSAARLGGSDTRSPLAYVATLLAWLVGPAMVVALFATNPENTDDKLFLGVGGSVTTIIAPFFIARNFRKISSQRARSRKLEQNGLPAIAEVIGRVEIQLDEGLNMGITMRFTGPGIETFIASVECSAEDAITVGTSLNALVDPADNHFRILR